MKRLAALVLLLTVLLPWRAGAHIGSPDVFFDGLAGTYPVSITIRMPGVVPGRAQINVQVLTNLPVAVAFVPIASQTPASNAPPPELAAAVPGASNIFAGELWLMTSGAYSIDVRVHGSAGDGEVQIPVNSVAIRQLSMSPYLTVTLACLGAVLFFGGIAIAAAAIGEGVLPQGVPLARRSRRRYWTAAIVTACLLSGAVFGGKRWVEADAAKFRSRLRDGGWPDLDAHVDAVGSQRILHLSLGEKDLSDEGRLKLARDHGKLLHLYLIQQPAHDVFAHIHPVRSGDKTFDVALPPLPEGDYEVLCDLTLAKSGFSSTATNTIHIPATPASQASSGSGLKQDPDDSWSTDAAATKDNSPGDTVFRMADGAQVIWKAHPALRALQPAALRFEVRDSNGKPAVLEPYMGMLSHAVILRSDGKIFAHLHPSGTISMAAQEFFDEKVGKKSAVTLHQSPEAFCGIPGRTGTTLLGLPYEFPAEGNYRLWVQIKIAGRVRTAIFDTTVQPALL